MEAEIRQMEEDKLKMVSSEVHSCCVFVINVVREVVDMVNHCLVIIATTA